MQIRNIIFDLGGVLINLDYYRTIEEFRKLGAVNLENVYQPPRQSVIFDEFEVGSISAAAFRAGVKKALEIGYVSDEQFDRAWNAMLLDIPRERLELVQKLRDEGYKVFLFSNTNEIHYDAFMKICQDTMGKSFDDYFDQAYYSFRLGQKKPNVEAFCEVLQRHDLDAQETLFVDDTLMHIQGAMQAGMRTFYMTKDRNLHDMLTHMREIDMSASIKKEKAKKGCGCTLL